MGDFVLNVNGARLSVSASPQETLLSVLRNRLNLTGTKYGCGEGQCGACTVLVDGRATRSCLVSVESAAHAKIVTIEGLEQNGKLSPVQQSFLDEGAFQCGYCTPGMIMSAIDIVNRHGGKLDEDTVRHELEGNICRCTGYHNIVKSVLDAAGRMKVSQAAE